MSRINNKFKTPFQEGYISGLLKGHRAENPYRIEPYLRTKQPKAFYQWNQGWRDWYGK